MPIQGGAARPARGRSCAAAEGAAIDPLTGAFLFSTFGGGDLVVMVSGFAAPQPQEPEEPPVQVSEPASIAVLALGSLSLVVAGQRR
ncbi:MAG: hypothetical protein WBE98_04935 [Gammaproteobacteria bacterium]